MGFLTQQTIVCCVGAITLTLAVVCVYVCMCVCADFFQSVSPPTVFIRLLSFLAGMFPGYTCFGRGGLFSKFAKLAKWRIFQKMSEFGLCNCCYSNGSGWIAFILGMELPGIDLHLLGGGLVHLAHIFCEFFAKKWRKIEV